MIQQIGLFPHRTIAQNIATVPGLVGWDRERTDARVTELLELISLPAEVADRYPAQLSGGQQQRVGVARALAADPPVMLMDEPFGAIDPINRERLQNEFLRLQAEIRKTILFVTHDIDEAIKMGDRIAILREGGHLAQYATPAELLMAPADDFVEDFVGADRALKRLALMRVSDIDLWEAPLAHVGQATGEVRAKLEGAEVPHALLVDSERRPLGWLSDADLRTGDRPAAGRLARPTRSSTVDDVMRDALSDVLQAESQYAPGGRRRRPDRRRPLGRDHPGVPLLRRGEGRGAPGGRAPARLRRSCSSCSPRSSVREAGQGATTCEGKNEGVLPDYVIDNIDDYVSPTVEHRRSSSPSPSSPGSCWRLLLAVISHRRGWLVPVFIGSTGILYTIPSIALFLLLLPITRPRHGRRR